MLGKCNILSRAIFAIRQPVCAALPRVYSKSSGDSGADNYYKEYFQRFHNNDNVLDMQFDERFNNNSGEITARDTIGNTANAASTDVHEQVFHKGEHVVDLHFDERFNKTDSGDFVSQKTLLSHTDEHGQINMVNIEDKPISKRTATAQCTIYLGPDAFEQVDNNTIEKGDVICIAKVGKLLLREAFVSLVLNL